MPHLVSLQIQYALSLLLAKEVKFDQQRDYRVTYSPNGINFLPLPLLIRLCLGQRVSMAKQGVNLQFNE